MATKRVQKKRGFALLPKAERVRIATLGGFAVQQQGVAHRFTSEEASLAGKKGAGRPRKRRRHALR